MRTFESQKIAQQYFIAQKVLVVGTIVSEQVRGATRPFRCHPLSSDMVVYRVAGSMHIKTEGWNLF